MLFIVYIIKSIILYYNIILFIQIKQYFYNVEKIYIENMKAQFIESFLSAKIEGGDNLDLKSRFFNLDDKKIKIMDKFTIPAEWWSRPYEYKWASEFLSCDDVILDAACGIEHPFKIFASKKVKKCYAVDKDKRVLELKSTKKLEYKCNSLECIDTMFEENTFDKIFCISVLEHIKPVQNIKQILQNFKKIIKPDGYIVLTIDHPFLSTDHFVNYVHASGLTFSSEADYKITENVIKGPYNGLKCYRAVLERYDSKIEQPDEIKPYFPNETK